MFDIVFRCYISLQRKSLGGFIYVCVLADALICGLDCIRLGML